MPDTRVTVVIATYNRPDTLAVAIKSVINQTYPGWKLMVIGDHCDERTAEVIDSFGDDRISYINLPIRFGEQAGPNSVGMALADTPFVALLNHDDIWLPDHLEKALESLDRCGRDFYIGRAAIARKSLHDEQHVKRPVFDRSSPLKRAPRNIYDKHWLFFEPVSIFLFKKETAQSMGPWHSASELYRAPLQDWLLRAWRMRVRFCFGREITVLNLVTHNQYKSRKGSYARGSTEHGYVDTLMQNRSSDAIRVRIREDMEKGGKERKGGRMFKTRNRLLKQLYRLVTNRLTAYLYLWTGWDVYIYILSRVGMQKSVAMVNTSIIRTGTAAPCFEDFDQTLEKTITDIKDIHGNAND